MKIQMQTTHPFSLPGGGTTYCRSVGLELAAMGHQVSVLCSKQDQNLPDCSEIDGLTVFAHRRAPPGLLWRLPSLNLIKRLLPVVTRYTADADLVISHSGRYALATKIAFPNKKVIYFCPGIESFHWPTEGGQRTKRLDRLCFRINTRLLRVLESRMLRTVDAVVASTGHCLDWLETWFGWRGENWRIVPMGASDSINNATRSPLQVRRDLAIPPDGVILLTVSALTVNKQTDTLVEALNLLRDPRLYLVIVGDGFQRAPLEQLVSQHQLQDRVRFTGYVPDPSDFYAAADLFALGSKYDTGPHAYHEAMMAGTAVIGPKMDMPHCFSPLSQIAELGRSGCTYRFGDPADLADKLRPLLNDHEKRVHMGRAARERASDHFSWKDHALQVLRISKNPTMPELDLPKDALWKQRGSLLWKAIYLGTECLLMVEWAGLEIL